MCRFAFLTLDKRTLQWFQRDPSLCEYLALIEFVILLQLQCCGQAHRDDSSMICLLTKNQKNSVIGIFQWKSTNVFKGEVLLFDFLSRTWVLRPISALSYKLRLKCLILIPQTQLLLAMMDKLLWALGHRLVSMSLCPNPSPTLCKDLLNFNI